MIEHAAPTPPRTDRESATSIIDRFPGGERVAPRNSPQSKILAVLLAAAWPPLLVTLPIWPPHHYWAGLDTDWRLVLLAVGLIATPIFMARLAKAKRPNNAPWTRRAVVARYVIYGGLLTAVLQILMTLILAIVAGFSGESFVQALGAIETVVLVFGVLGVPLALMVGVSYALWGGLCVAYIGYKKVNVSRF